MNAATPRLTQDEGRLWIIRGLALLGLAAAIGLLIWGTEWVEVDEPVPVKEERHPDPFKDLKTLAAGVGVTVLTPDNLATLPPAGGTLWLDSRHWDLFEGRAGQLQAWVQAGGHLVLPEDGLENEHLRTLSPIRQGEPPRRTPAAKPACPPPRHADTDADEDEDADEATDRGDGDSPAPPRAASAPAAGCPAPAPAPVRRAAASTAGSHTQVLAPQRRCEWVPEADAQQPSYTHRPALNLCRLRPDRLRVARGSVLWGLGEPGRYSAVRVPAGRGDITVVANWNLAGTLEEGLDLGDEALLMGALFDFHAGQTVWVVTDEQSPPLPLWLWQHGRAPLLLAALAIVLGLWRMMSRFGPALAPPPTGRRSMAAQVRGTGAFIGATAPAALHRAVRRAFDDTLRSQLAQADELSTDERLDALTARLPLDRARLAAAMQPPPKASLGAWLAAIATLEHARRQMRRQALPGRRPD